MGSTSLYELTRGLGNNDNETKGFIENFTPESCSYISEFNQSLLQSALTSDKYDIAKFLIEQECNLIHQDDRGNTILHYLLGGYNNENKEIYDELLELLLEKNIRLDLGDEHGNQPLWVTVLNAKVPLSVVNKLLEMGADPHHKNKAGRSPYDMVKKYDIKELNEIFEPYV
jgi:ankyrin repeat protein